MRKALSLLSITRAELDHGSKSWATVRGPSVFITLLVCGLLPVPWMMTEGRNFYLGDLLIVLVILILPSMVEGALRLTHDVRDSFGLIPLFSGAHLGVVLLYFGWKNPLPWTWPGWLAVTLTAPLGALAAKTLRGGALDFRSKIGVATLALLVPYGFLAIRLMTRVIEADGRWGLQGNLHDSMGLFALVGLGWVIRLAILRSMQLNEESLLAEAPEQRS